MIENNGAPKPPKRRKKSYALSRMKYLTPDEVGALEATLLRNLSKPAHFRDALLISIALHTGGRALEVLNLKVRDFDPRAQSIYITGIKGSRDREVPIPKWLAIEIQAFIKAKGPQDRLFDISYPRLRQIWLIYRPANKVFHSLRHTFALRVYLRTKDVRLLQLALGHKSILNTIIYVDYVHSMSELRRILGE